MGTSTMQPQSRVIPYILYCNVKGYHITGYTLCTKDTSSLTVGLHYDHAHPFGSQQLEYKNWLPILVSVANYSCVTCMHAI